MKNYLNVFTREELESICLAVLLSRENWMEDLGREKDDDVFGDEIVDKIDHLDTQERRDLDHRIGQIMARSEEYGEVCDDMESEISDRNEAMENFIRSLVNRFLV